MGPKLITGCNELWDEGKDVLKPSVDDIETPVDNPPDMTGQTVDTDNDTEINREQDLY